MAVTVYKSTDASAPVLTGQVGSMTALLLACLVNGYGAKAAAGWTNPFNGTNQRAFRPGSGVQHYFSIDDNGGDGGGIAGAKEAVFYGSETMAAWASVTGQFPTTAQNAATLVARKSATADATARTWIVVADDRTCYVFVQTGDTAGIYSAFMFGEMFSLLSVTDNYRSLVIGRTATNSSVASEFLDNGATNSASAVSGHYMPRTYTGLGTSKAVGKFGNPAFGGAVIGGATGALTTPDPDTGAIVVAPLKVTEGGGLRGRMRGLFQLCHSQAAFADGDTITGVNGYAGRTFLIIKGTGSTGAYTVDITGPWETN